MRRPSLLISMKRQLLRALMIGAFMLIALGLPATAIAAPPANDNFANATKIGAAPFSSTQDLSTATVQAREPSPSCFSASNTAGFIPSTRKRRKEPTEWTTEKWVPDHAGGRDGREGRFRQEGLCPVYVETATVVSRHVAVRHTKGER